MSMPVIITIDPGQNLGYAIWDDTGDEFPCYGLAESGHIEAQGKDRRQKILYVSRNIESIVTKYMERTYSKEQYCWNSIDILIEDVINTRYPSQITMAAMAQMVWQLEIAIPHNKLIDNKSFIPTSWKKRFTGSGKATKKDVINKLKELNYKVNNDNEADAIAIGLVYLQDRKEKVRNENK